MFDTEEVEDVRFTAPELKVIARLAQNLLSSAIDAGGDPGELESIYYKTQYLLD